MLLKEEECTQGEKHSTAQNATCFDETMQHKIHNYTSNSSNFNWTPHYSVQHQLSKFTSVTICTVDELSV